MPDRYNEAPIAGAVLGALAVVPVAVLMPARNTAFLSWSALICIAFGVVHFVGLRQAWTRV